MSESSPVSLHEGMPGSLRSDALTVVVRWRASMTTTPTPDIIWTDEQLWNLFTPLAAIIADALSEFRERCNHGYPARMSEDGWNATLGSMIRDLEAVAGYDAAKMEEQEQIAASASLALHALAGVFFSLWD